MANIVAYSSGYKKNTYYNQVGVYQVGSSGAAVAIFEPVMPAPEKSGDAPVTTVTLTVPIVKFDNTTAVASGDQMFICPLPTGAKVTGLQVDVTSAATGTALTVNVGNATSATAYLSALDLKTAANTAPTQVVLDAAAVGASNTDAVVFTFATVTAPSGGATVKLTVTMSVPG